MLSAYVSNFFRVLHLIIEIYKLKIISANIQEAREQLEEIEKEIKNHPEYDEVGLRLGLEHTYHHMNYAWNIRNESVAKLANYR